jgi:hypothetical protein
LFHKHRLWLLHGIIDCLDSFRPHLLLHETQMLSMSPPELSLVKQCQYLVSVQEFLRQESPNLPAIARRNPDLSWTQPKYLAAPDRSALKTIGAAREYGLVTESPRVPASPPTAISNRSSCGCIVVALWPSCKLESKTLWTNLFICILMWYCENMIIARSSNQTVLLHFWEYELPINIIIYILPPSIVR